MFEFFVGFIVGMVTMFAGVVAFWSHENRRYRRRYGKFGKPDEHASEFQRRTG